MNRLQSHPPSAGPSRQALAVTLALVVVVHVALLWGAPDALHLSLRPDALTTPAFQTRLIPMPPVSTAPAPAPVKRAAPAPSRRAHTEPPPTSAPPAEVNEAALPPASTAAPELAAPLPDSTVAQAADPAAAVPPTEPLSPTPPPPMALAVGALPPSMLLSYKLTGQERGLTYYASGELRWQHNPANYEASLTIKAFLLGARVFSSVGSVGTQGLVPVRFADKWRGEKATHFDAENRRINFSNNKPSADLQPGAQDQVSLFVQLAAAMAGDPDQYKPGSSVSIQTATVNEAVPWTLTLQSEDTVSIDGKPLTTSKWVCLPRGKFDTQVELWLSRPHAWMPVRIRITQVSGSFIDMTMENIQPLAPLAGGASPN